MIELPPGVSPLPPNPPPPLSDADSATRALRIKEMSEQFVETTATYIERVWREYAPWCRWREGTCTALDTAVRKVVVDVDPGPGNLEPIVGLRADYGRPKWTASKIVGKRVKVMFDTHPQGRGVWIDVVTSAPPTGGGVPTT